MSSASPGRYQSRLFNFLSSQTLRVKEGLAQTLRHLKVKVNWGLEALLYQLRAISAIVKRAGKRLGQGFSPKHTLEGNTEATAKSATTLPGSTTAAASQLRATSDTEAKQLPQGTIDPDLMIHLSESPITDSPLSLLFESLDAKVAQLEAGGWQQVPQAVGGAVVKAWQKVGWPAVRQEEITTQGQQFPEKIAALLLAAVAYFFGGTSEPPGMPPEQGQEQLNGAETGGLPSSPSPRLPVSSLGAKFRLSVLKAQHQIKQWGTALVSDREFTPEPLPDRIENLIRAAVDYFLRLGKTSLPSDEPNEVRRGDGETGRLGDGETRRQGAKAQPCPERSRRVQTGELAGELEGDLWREPQAGAVLNGSESLGIPKAREMARSLRRKVQEAVKAAPLMPKSQVTTGKPQVVNETQAVATGGAATLELERATAAQTEWQPDFLETRAVVTGYVKHPLELVLEWLDRALVWVETAIGKLWRLGMQWWQGLQNRTK
ncbi:MAG TPA: hypothetical protein IGS52_10235 [Oscillatoriaceae cyanobacterium M33_DOE_052]|uniref:Uncharacterized protein n=1 Tax=Planktothricoides sp. SpSt-374 TaxID=2282167 RepID=A0A7C3ZJ62_9CYAN|nr:hypothetical protein [Oscillatoriaceae cyanobacterium M33_DOE_052]